MSAEPQWRVCRLLTIKALKGGGGAAHYYSPETGRRDQRPDEYYGEVGADVAPSWWTPRGSLGVEDGAAVKPGELREAMAGRDPGGSGTSLVRVTKAERRGGFDLHLAPPKGVSVLFAAADPQTRRGMLEDMRAAAVETVAALHARGAFVVRTGAGGKTREAAADVAVAVVPHQTARDGAPQLHVHLVLVNIGRLEGGKTGSLNIDAAFAAKGEAGALFRAGVAASLERRGVAVERVPGDDKLRRAASFRVAGIDPALEKAFSTRRETMERAAGPEGLAEDGAKRAKQTERLARSTRGAKAQVPTGTALEARWRAIFAERGIAPEQVWERAREAARGVERPVLSAAEAVALRVQRSGEEAPDAATLRREVAVEAQYRGEGTAGALREMARLERNGVAQTAREAERTLDHARGGPDRAALVADLARDLGRGFGGAGGGGVTGDAPPPTPKERRRRRGQDRGQER